VKDKRLLGIDIGGTNIKYGLYDDAGRSLDEGGMLDTVRDDLEILLEKIYGIVEKYDMLDGLGISVPGGVDKESGIVFEGGAIRSLDRVDLRGILAKRYDFPVAIENDANCATLAEKWLGNGKNSETFVCMTIGTGVGGGMIIGGKLHVGHRDFAGEFGYMRVHASDKNKLSLHEASTEMLLNSVKDVGFSLTGKEFFEKLDSGEKIIEEIYADWIDRLAEGIFNIAVVIDPEKILIGGGISSQQRIYADIRASIARLIEVSAYYIAKIEIMPCHFHNDAGKIGAIYKLLSEGVVCE